MIRLLIVDDHEILRLGLSVFCESCDDMELVGQAGNGEEAVALCRQLHPDVVLMDVAMPVMDGITATAIINDLYPHISVVILTSSISGERAEEALKVGAWRYLRKNIMSAELAEAIRSAVASPIP
jgi:two-component system, NarL family, response regulator LiaR